MSDIIQNQRTSVAQAFRELPRAETMAIWLLLHDTPPNLLRAGTVEHLATEWGISRHLVERELRNLVRVEYIARERACVKSQRYKITLRRRLDASSGSFLKSR